MGAPYIYDISSLRVKQDVTHTHTHTKVPPKHMHEPASVCVSTRVCKHTHKSFVEHKSILLLHSNLPTADRLIHIYKAVKYANPNPKGLSQTGIQW